MIKFQAVHRLLSRLPGPLGTALLLHLAFSSSGYAFCIWFAFIPLFRSIRKRPPLQALIQGLISGFIFYYFNLFWITNSIRNFSALPLPLVWLVLALLAIYLSLYFGLFSLLLAASPAVSWLGTLFLASCWTLLEWLRGTLFVGFPWNNLGVALGPACPVSMPGSF
jgi:apolipoprotein N-acyltransferase